MCKPGAACCGCDAASSGLGVGIGVVALAAVVSVTATLVTDILTMILVIVLSAAAAAAVLLAVILHRTRSLSTRRLRSRLLRPAAQGGRALPGGLAAPGSRALPAAAATLPPAIESRPRLAIEGRSPQAAAGAAAWSPRTPERAAAPRSAGAAAWTGDPARRPGGSPGPRAVMVVLGTPEPECAPARPGAESRAG